MSTHAGVWIDHKQAIVVRLSETGQEIQTIAFDLGQPASPTKSSRRKHKFTPNDFVAEDTLERKRKNDRNCYFDDIVASIGGAADVLVFGPGEAKVEFSKHIQGKKLRGLAVVLETADKMTNRQVAAKVKTYFAVTPAKKSAAPKKKMAKKAAKSAVKKP
jgi:hypothetical protein